MQITAAVMREKSGPFVIETLELPLHEQRHIPEKPNHAPVDRVRWLQVDRLKQPQETISSERVEVAAAE